MQNVCSRTPQSSMYLERNKKRNPVPAVISKHLLCLCCSNYVSSPRLHSNGSDALSSRAGLGAAGRRLQWMLPNNLAWYFMVLIQHRLMFDVPFQVQRLFKEQAPTHRDHVMSWSMTELSELLPGDACVEECLLSQVWRRRWKHWEIWMAKERLKILRKGLTLNHSAKQKDL